MFARRPESGLGPWDPPAPRPDAVSVWPHDQTLATASIYGPVDRANFLWRHYSKLAQNPVGHLWVRRKNSMRQRRLS